MSRQTIIPIASEDDASLESFYSERNQPLIKELKQLLNGDRAKRILYLWGESGSGKTHLLDACCRAAGKSGHLGLYVSLKQDSEQLGMLNSVKSQALVGIDDLQQIVGSKAAQVQIFSLYERILNSTGAIIVSGDRPLSGMKLELKDLESRLLSGGTFNIYELDDDEKKTALKLRASTRGFILEDNVIAFIMSHYQRDTKSLFSLLDRLDSASLQAHRKITIPFVKSQIPP